MRIIIAGAGDVGFYLAKMLISEFHDIVMIDKNPKKIQYVESHLDAMTIEGSATSLQVLHDAGIRKADLLVAVTSNEDTNIACAILGKKLGAEKAIARISNVEFLSEKGKNELMQMGIDSVISPEGLAAKEIVRLINRAAVSESFDFSDGKLSMVGISLGEKAEILEKSLMELGVEFPDNKFICVAIQRGSETLIPRGDTRFKLNDHAFFITVPEGSQHILSITGKKKVEINNLMILGASKTGVHAARMLEHKYHVKLIEINKEKCMTLTEDLPDSLIVNGDGQDLDLLIEEGLETMDAFIAVTGNSETNIISCLMAKNKGVARTIAQVENIEYIRISKDIGIDTIINKKNIAVNNIFRYIRKGDVVALTGILGMDSEVLEFEVNEGNKITRKPVRKLKFPKTAIIGGVVRDGKGFITLGDFQIQVDDRVVVFCLPEAISEVEAFFK